jgi:hypothetical protein
MCDYSLQHAKSRAANVGDKLVTGQIVSASPYTGEMSNSYTRGVHAEDDNTTAVCLLPGTELAFAQAPIRFFGLEIGRQDKIATFRQINKEQPCMHHDAIEFVDGEVKLLHELEVGQRLTVLQLPAQPKTPTEAAEQKRLEVVG